MIPYPKTMDSLSWEDLQKLTEKETDTVNGPNNSQSKLRLFGNSENDIKVTLFRDHHAWCPYCQKIWLWLEWKQIPYRVKKVTMRCYGKKENWYLDKVPSGMLPALELNKELIKESDLILLSLEREFGPLGRRMREPSNLKLRNLERKLFRVWCQWLCSPRTNSRQENKSKENFEEVIKEVGTQLTETNGPWLDTNQDNHGRRKPGTIDLIFIPFLERMNASLAYYKGFSLRYEHPAIDKWFQALELEEVYRGTQGDFHTHAHDLPPQMGGCYISPNEKQKQFSFAIDDGEGLGTQEINCKDSKLNDEFSSKVNALTRVIKHRQKIMELNPLGPKKFDQPLRAALTNMMNNEFCQPEKGSAAGLRYLRDRISVPRDMSLLAARKLRQSLEQTAKLDGTDASPPLSKQNRYDQNPEPFLKSVKN